MITVSPTSGWSRGSPPNCTAAAQTAANAERRRAAPPRPACSNGARNSACTAAPGGSATVIAAPRRCRATTIGASAAGASDTSMARDSSACASSRPRPARWRTSSTGSPMATRSPRPRHDLDANPRVDHIVEPAAPGAERHRGPTHQLGLQSGDVPGACGGHLGAIGSRGKLCVIVDHPRVPTLMGDHLRGTSPALLPSPAPRAPASRPPRLPARCRPPPASAPRAAPRASRGRSGRGP